MMTAFQSEIGLLKAVLLKHPRDAFVNDSRIREQWKGLHYQGAPDFSRALREYEAFVTILADSGVELHFLPPAKDDSLDAIYVRDASIVCGRGAILCNMGKAARAGEPAAQEALFRALGMPIVGRIRGEGRLEGGDVAWLDERTLAVARSYRSNDQGIRQLAAILEDGIADLTIVPLPHWRGPGDVFHLMSILSPIDRDLALVFSALMPIGFRELLLARDIRLVEVPEEEFETMGCNVLALGPRRCLMLEGNPRTRRRLEEAGAEVLVFAGTEICLKGGGGPTCLTRPLRRA